jgi:Trypsin-like peptidase domain
MNGFTRVLFLAILSVAFLRTLLSQTSGLEAQRSAVVKLRIHRPNQADETAAGIFVGKDQQNAYFITAYHAIAEKPQGVTVASIDLQCYSSPTRSSAFVFDNFDDGLDLGVVETPVANLPQGLQQLVQRDVTVNTVVRIIGHPSAGDWSVWSGNVLNEYGSNADVHHFTTNRDGSLAGGYSGGPVFDLEGGFLGMHTSTTSSYGVVAKSAEIVTQLKAWRVPINNISTNSAAGVRGDRDEINKVLDLYVAAYNRKDKDALWKVWPNAPEATKRLIENSFGSARSISMKLTDVEVELRGVRAIVTAQYSQEFIPRNGNEQKAMGSIVFELQKVNGAWVIVSVK